VRVFCRRRSERIAYRRTSVAMSEAAGRTSPGRLVPLGEIVGTHGVGGLLRLHPYSDGIAALTTPRLVYLQRRPARGVAPDAASDTSPDTWQPRRLVSAREHGRGVLLRFEDLATIEAATPLVGTVLAIPEDELPAAAPGEFYAYQLEGLEVVTDKGDRLGTVHHLIPTGSNEVLVVRNGEREHLIPVIADVIRRVDLADRKIVIEPIEGLLD
jgi:16S rRNA processing protein RimM